MKDHIALTAYTPTGETFATQAPKVGDLALCPFATQVLEVVQVQTLAEAQKGIYSPELHALTNQRYPKGRVFLRQHKGQQEYVHVIGHPEARECRYVTEATTTPTQPGQGERGVL